MLTINISTYSASNTTALNNAVRNSGMIPSLLYHSASPTLYPTDLPGETLLAIRFPAVVRVSSVRIIPQGVKSFNSEGVTEPSTWTGQLLFNISSSNPVNALSSTSITVTECQHALDYPIDMHEGVTTRLMMLRSPATALTISIYGYPGNANAHEQAGVAAEGVTDSTGMRREAEDWSWLWTWAGEDTGALLALVDETTELQTRKRALESLELLTTIDQERITSLLLDHPWTIPSVLASPALAQSLLAEPAFALHPLVSEHVPTTHELYPLAHASSSARHREAWRHLHLGQGALMCLEGGEEEALMRVERGEEKSNLIRLVEQAESYAQAASKESTMCLTKILDILDPPPISPMALSYLADRLPRLTAIANTLTRSEQRRHLSLPPEYANRTVTSLLHSSSEVVQGTLVYPFAVALAKPYLPHLAFDDPLRTAFTETPQPLYTTANSRLSRLVQSLLSNPTPSSLQHSATPSELLSILAPALVESLSTAVQPPFGIAPNTAYSSPDTQGASAWAGKVYSDHQFRTREGVVPNLGSTGAGVGLGIGGPGMGMGMGMGMGGGASRPASRHVDEYAR